MTPRNRRPGREWLPAHVQWARGRYEYVIGKGRDRTVRGLVTSRTPPENADAELRRQVTRAADELVRSLTQPARRTVATLVEAYRDSDRWRELSRATQRDYADCYRQALPVMGHISVEALTAGKLTQYMDHRAKTSKVRANHELASISAAYAWGAARDWVQDNPTRHVRKFPTPRRKRYVTDEEFESCRAGALPVLQAAMDLALITGLRIGDLLALRWRDWTAEGLLVETSKTGEALLFERTAELAAAVEACRALPERPDICPYLLATRGGSGYTVSGFGSMWQRHQRAWGATSGMERFRFHDLRAKSATDHETGEHLGHRRTDVLQSRYRNRLPKRVMPLEVKR